MSSVAAYSGFDKQVYHLFELLDSGRPDLAYDMFDQIRNVQNRAQIDKKLDAQGDEVGRQDLMA